MKPFKFLLSVIVFLVFLEMFLRLNGFLFLQYKEYLNRAVSTGNMYKIVCVGDSSTAEGGERSYPSQLEKILNAKARNIRFKVINEGMVGVASPAIMDSFESVLDKDKPDMVIVMMGANDRRDLNAIEKANFFTSLRVYKLFKALAGNITDHLADRSAFLRKPPPPEKSPFKIVPQKYVQRLLLGISAERAGVYDVAEDILVPLLGVSDLDVTFQQRVASELSNCYSAQKKYSELMDTLKFNLEVWDYEVGATGAIHGLCRQKIAKDEVIGMLTRLVDEKPDDVPFNSLLEGCYAQYGDNEKAQYYLNRLKVIRNTGDIGILKSNYIKLNKILKMRNIKGIYVQYPLRDVNDLKRLFDQEDDNKQITFVDNGDAFKEALKPGKFSDYFVDREMNDFGHCTPLGNHLLASTVADAVLKYLNLYTIP